MNSPSQHAVDPAQPPKAATAPLQDKLNQLVRAAENLLLGLACGDALGVPVATCARGSFCVQGMQGFGTHGQPAGTWSDDTSLALCQACSLKPGGSDLQVLARHLQDWYHRGFFTAGGASFDIGPGMARALARLPRAASPELAGGSEERDNGNACLVRTAPLFLALLGTESAQLRFCAVKQACRVTHGHPLASACCFVLAEFARHLWQLRGAEAAYQALCLEFAGIGRLVPDYPLKLASKPLARSLGGGLAELTEDDIASGNYVVNTLEAALWCLLTTSSYCQAVLKSVNLGEDTDTTAALSGALAGLLHGADAIPSAWLEALARRNFLRQAAHKAAQMVLGLRGPGRLEPGFA